MCLCLDHICELYKKTDEPMEVLFGVLSWVAPRNHLSGGGPGSPREMGNIGSFPSQL